MIDLDKIYNKTLSEKVDIDPFGDVYIKLLTVPEVDDLIKKSVAEQIAYCLLDERGERHFSDEKVEEIKTKMTTRHQSLITDEIMRVNRFGLSFDDDVKK